MPANNTPISPEIDYPSAKTLAKYGLTSNDFFAIMERQGFVCPICGRVPTPSKKTGKRRWVIDHVHVRGWKDMPPEKKRTYVRGITDWFCNRNYLAKGMTIEKAERMVRYLNGKNIGSV